MVKRHVINVLKYKIGILSAIIILGFAFLQTPAFKGFLIREVVSRLSEETDATVSIGDVEGFIPFNLSFYDLKLEKEKQAWVEVDSIRFDWTLVKFLLLRKGSLHMAPSGIRINEIEGVTYDNPEEEVIADEKEERKEPFSWPQLPISRLSLRVSWVLMPLLDTNLLLGEIHSCLAFAGQSHHTAPCHS